MNEFVHQQKGPFLKDSSSSNISNQKFSGDTPRKTNMSPKNGGFQ